MKSSDRYYIFSLFFIYSVIRIVFLLKPFPEINGFAIPDDAYISLEIARNFAHGKWFFYGVGHTSGFQPLYVFLMTPVFLIFKNDLITPVYIALIIQSIFGIGTIYILYKTLRTVFEDEYSPFLSVLLYILLPVTISNTANGLETSISFFFLSLIFYYLYSFEAADINNIPLKKIFLFGIIAGLSLLARIDNVMAIPGIFAWVIMKGKISNHIKQLMYFISGVALIYLPYIILSFNITGDILPVSGKAVHQIANDMVINYSVGNSNVFELLKLSFKNIYTNYSIVILFAIAGTFVFRIKTLSCPWFKGSFKKHLPLLITSALLFVSYTFYLNAYWFYSRYFFSLGLLFVVITAFVSNRLILSFNTALWKRAAFAVVLLLFISGNLLRPGFKDFFFGEYKKKGYDEIGKWVNKEFQPGTVIGGNQTGATGYFAIDKTVINLDGVVNKEAYDAIRKKEVMEYIRSKRIEYFIDWEINYEFVKRNSKNFREGDLELVKKAEGVKSWDYEWCVYRVRY